MKTFKELIEKRSNPDLNPRIPAYQYIIDKGYNSPEYFFTFTNFVKVGMNPRSGYDTPNGIYCYPSNILDELGGKMNKVPYAQSAPYIHVLRLRSNKGVVDPFSRYTKSDLNRDIEKIKNFYKSRMKSFNEHDFEYMIDVAEEEAFSQTPFGYFWNITRSLSSDQSLNIGLGWGGVKDDGNFRKEIPLKQSGSHVTLKGIGSVKDSGKYRVHKVFIQGVTGNSQGWNNLMRSLGYNGFVDREGTGIIHVNEPTQACFMSMENIEVVDMVLNKEYERIGTNSGVASTMQKLEKANNSVVLKSENFKTDEYYQEKFIKHFKESDITGCEILIENGKFYVSQGNIHDGNFEGTELFFNKVLIHNGEFKRTNIQEAIISGGIFKNSTRLTNVNIAGGRYLSVNFYETSTIRGGTFTSVQFKKMRFVGKNVLESCLLEDCWFDGDCKVIGGSIQYRDKPGIIDNDKLSCQETRIDGGYINAGIYYNCKFTRTLFKGGNINYGNIENSEIKDGTFSNIHIFNTKNEGGTYGSNVSWDKD